MELSDIHEIRGLLSRHGFSFDKRLGQNFLIDPDVCPHMADEAIPGPEYGVLEIGPGIGVLTVELARRAAKVVSVELDDRLFPILEETLAGFDNVHLVHGDVLKLDLAALLAEEFPGMPVVVCANLPYYITSPVIMKLLGSSLPVESLTVMVQAEAADRLCAEVGTRAAGAVTVAIRFYAEAEQLFFVPKESFLPAPKVNSEVIRLTLRDKPAAVLDSEDAFFGMVKGAFGQRRKTIVNSLSAGLSLDKAAVKALLESLDIPPTARIEQLSLEDLLRIYQASRN